MTNMSLKLDRNIYYNEEKKNGFNVFLKEREEDYKLVIKRVRSGQIKGGALYYESLNKNRSFKGYFKFVIDTIEDNKQLVNNLTFWKFGDHVFKHLLQRRE